MFQFGSNRYERLVDWELREPIHVFLYFGFDQDQLSWKNYQGVDFRSPRPVDPGGFSQSMSVHKVFWYWSQGAAGPHLKPGVVFGYVFTDPAGLYFSTFLGVSCQRNPYSSMMRSDDKIPSNNIKYKVFLFGRW